MKIDPQILDIFAAANDKMAAAMLIDECGTIQHLAHSSEVMDDFKILLSTPFGIQPIDSENGMIFRLIMKYSEPLPGDEFGGKRIGLEIVKSVVQIEEKQLSEDTPLAQSIFRDALSRVLEKAEKTEIEKTEGPQILFEINKASTRIASVTRRGTGNFVIASKRMMEDILHKVDLHGFSSFLQMYQCIVEDSMDDDTVVLAYKSNNGQVDAGLIIAPHHMKVFEPGKEGFTTRYAIDDSYEKSYDYYQILKVK